jgi:large subunit ribosomal protein L22
MKSTLSNLRISPRKVRLVAGLVKGKTVDEALAQLSFLTKRSASPVAKAISSAVANAVSGTSRASKDKLVVKNVTVNEGVTLKRIMPRAHGRAFRINKRTSRVQVELGHKQ